VTVCGTDQVGRSLCKSDDAVVTYLDVVQPPTLSKTATAAACQIDVNYAVVVTNSSTLDALTLNTLTDNVYGSITTAHAADTSCTGSATPGDCEQVVSTTCGQPPPGAGTLPALIATGGNYTCSFVGRINTCNTVVVDVVQGTATDDDNHVYPDADNPFNDHATVSVPAVGLQ
jgi:hypothetical protein